MTESDRPDVTLCGWQDVKKPVTTTTLIYTFYNTGFHQEKGGGAGPSS